ncbi:MAG: O-antigen ligase family protein [Alphaproteobacteria bacterium]
MSLITLFSSQRSRKRPASPPVSSKQKFLTALFLAYIFILVLAPLPLGSNRMWSASLLAVWANLLLLLFLGIWALRPEILKVPLSGTMKAATTLAVVVVIWIILQTVSWTPDAWHHPMWGDAQRLLAQQGFKDTAGMRGAVALDPSASAEHLVRLLSYIASFWLAYFLALDSRRAKILLAVIIGTGMVYAFYGFIVEATGTNTVLWFKKRAYIDNMTSTFFNRNSYAAYAGLGLLSATVLVFYRWRNIWRESTGRQLSSEGARYFFWSDFLTKLAAGELLWLLLPIALFVALIFSASRAGFASCMGGMAVLALALALNKRMRWSRIFMIFGLLVLFSGVMLALGGTQLAVRLNANTIAEDLPSRLNVYALTWEAIEANPWLGYGFGNFDTAFRLYRDPTVIGWFEEAHNDYLETIMDLGFPMALIWFSVIGLLVLRCVHGVWTRKRDGIYPALALAATVQEGLHSIFDFSLQIPAVAFTYAAILGMGVAQSWSSRELGKKHAS